MSFSRRATVWTCLISLTLGLAVGVFYFFSAWQRSGHPRHYLNGHYYGENKLALDAVTHAVDAWREEYGSLPESLKGLDFDEDYYVRKNEEGEVYDMWGRPLIYQVDGDDYEVISYGEDGKPGGVWFDSDLSNRGPYPPESFPPSLEVYWNSELAINSIILSVLVGFVCFACSFWLLCTKVPPSELSEEERAKFKKQRIVAFMLKLIPLAFIVLASLAMAFMLGTVHLVHGEYH